ncbi:MAG: uracil-DNA glycosylase [Kangiellaceae bacterium]|nr:uracil-DNA glycosylase [Kangiellaceae bacterium]
MTNWPELLASEKEKKYFIETMEYVANRREQGITVYPEEKFVFSALSETPFDQVKVVILGQDPYHGPNQAHGLCFSVLPGVKTPPSLVNIYKELKQDIDGFEIPNHGYLQSWAKQGVLLLNTVLTVEQGEAHSHKKLGWEKFSDNVIEQLNEYRENIVFLLWGAHAQKKGARIDQQKHHILKAPHPSPLSAHRGFLGCQHFSETNRILTELNQTVIDWDAINIL